MKRIERLPYENPVFSLLPDANQIINDMWCVHLVNHKATRNVLRDTDMFSMVTAHR